MPTQPRPEQMQAFIEQVPDGPIYMLNLLKFKAQAEYADGRETDLTGAQAYGLYGQGVGKLIAELGGRLVWSAQMNVMVIGDGEPEWDAIGIVEYPSIEAFQGMVASPAWFSRPPVARCAPASRVATATGGSA